jgi:cytochrome c biogenesis factor
MAISEDPRTPGFDARAAVVNRTHRVIRERATAMRERKRSTRDLIVPFVVCSALLLFIAAAVVHVTDESISDVAGLWKRIVDLGADAGSEVSLLLLWFLPLSVITAAVVLLRRNRRTSNRNDKVR